MSTDRAGELAYEIVSKVAAEADVSAMELDPPLGETVDIDAITRLVDSIRSRVRVTFEYHEAEVTVASADGDVDVFVRPLPAE